MSVRVPGTRHCRVTCCCAYCIQIYDYDSIRLGKCVTVVGRAYRLVIMVKRMKIDAWEKRAAEEDNNDVFLENE